MPGAQAPKADPAAGVAPAPQASAPWRVVAVEPLTDRRLKVTFTDGTTGEVHLHAFLESPQVRGTIFEALRDAEFFARVRAVLGAVTWPNGADLAPDAMYEAIRDSGHWIVGA